MGSQRVEHNWAQRVCVCVKIMHRYKFLRQDNFSVLILRHRTESSFSTKLIVSLARQNFRCVVKYIWDGLMASPAWWTWVWVSFGSYWWTGTPGVRQSMASQRVGHDWATELNWILRIFDIRKGESLGFWIHLWTCVEYNQSTNPDTLQLYYQSC